MSVFLLIMQRGVEYIYMKCDRCSLFVRRVQCRSALENNLIGSYRVISGYIFTNLFKKRAVTFRHNKTTFHSFFSFCSCIMTTDAKQTIQPQLIDSTSNAIIRQPLLKPRLTLARREACTYPTQKINVFHPNYYLMRQCKNYPLRVYGKILVDRFVISNTKHSKNIDCDLVYPVNIDLCTKYLFNIDDEVHELAFVLNKSLKKLRKRSVSKSMLLKVIKHFLVLNGDQDKELIHSYIDLLLSSGYIDSVGFASDDIYKISAKTKLGFGSQTSQRSQTRAIAMRRE